MVNNNIAVLRYVRELLERIRKDYEDDFAHKGDYLYDVCRNTYFDGRMYKEWEYIALLEAKEKELMEAEEF